MSSKIEIVDVPRAAGMYGLARKAAKASFDSDVPMPEWAKKALEAGWKMPKGWKP